MDDKSPSSGDRLRTNWTPSMDRYFIDLVLDQVCKGNMTDNACRKQIWIHMISLFNTKFGSQYDKDVLRNRYKTIRRQYNDIKILLEQGGFSWDKTRQMVIAEDSVWDDYIKAHPDVRTYRTKIVPYYNDLCVIYGNTTADGINNSSDHGVDFEDDTLEAKISGISEDLQCPVWSIAYEEVDNVKEDSSLPSGNMVWEFVEEGTVDSLTDRMEAVPLVTNRKKEANCPTLVSNGQGGLPIGDIVGRSAEEEMVDALFDRAATILPLADEKENESSVEVQTGSSHLDMEMARGSTIDGMMSSLSESLVNDVQDSLHTSEDMMMGSIEQDTLDTPEGEAGVSLLGNGKEENSCSFIVKEVQQDLSHLGEDMIRGSVEGVTVDTPEITAKDGTNPVDNVVEDSSQSRGDVMNGRTDEDIEDSLYEVGVVFAPVTNIKKANSGCIPVNNVQDSSYSEWDMLTERDNERTVDSPFEKVIVVSSTENKKNNNSNQSVSMNSALQADNNRSRVTWTPTMDRYFINLMLDHVRRGNKIGRSFNKQAWMDMMVLFNGKFGFQYDKDVLKNRYKTLRRQYTDIRSLLGQNGFSWNGTLQMVTADVHAWDDYIKAHPNARQYRTRPMPYYNDLCAIYANAAVDGKCLSSERNVNPDDISGVKIGLNSPATSVDQEDLVDNVPELSPLGEDVRISGQQSKRKCTTAEASQHFKKPRCSEEGMVNALREMATAVTSLADKKKDDDSSFSIENVVGAIQAIPDIDEDLLLDACDFLEDEKKARTFMALDVRLRKKWLMRKLRT